MLSYLFARFCREGEVAFVKLEVWLTNLSTLIKYHKRQEAVYHVLGKEIQGMR